MPRVRVQQVFKNYHPYTYVRHEFTRTIKGEIYRVFNYGAYNALGLIGSENNGIAVASDTRREIVLDEHCRQSAGWYTGYNGPSQAMLAEMQRLASMPARDFLTFIRTHPRSRLQS